MLTVKTVHCPQGPETIHECESVVFTPCLAAPDGVGRLTLFSQDREIGVADTGVSYVMNDKGKTVGTYYLGGPITDSAPEPRS